jgi:sterol desaturase/sphingolipid hydroxylase (fatty acid hydroxylase superfamily)
MPTWMKAGWIFFLISLFWILEGYYSQFKFNYKKWRHAKTNFIFLLCTIIINTSFGILTIGVFNWLATSKFGLLHLMEVPVWLELILALIVLDFIAQFGVHYLLHKVPVMWRLHLVHHTDKHIDATSGTRHHPFDFIFREIAALSAVMIMGMPISFYFFYRILGVFFTYFTHSNIALPLWLDKGLSYLIVTPNMHKFHHHNEAHWTDSNYGNILSIWDRIFGTFVYGDLSKIKYGLDIADHTNDEDPLVQFKMPFNKKVNSKK